jgi:hypothetical protein
MNTDIPLDEPVAPDKYPYRQNGRQQNRQTPQKIAFEASSYRHIFEQQSFAAGNFRIFVLPLPAPVG